jgi:hypothetical protein
MTAAGRAGILNPGRAWFLGSAVRLQFGGNNNGSAFAGLSANTPFYNVLLAVAMWFGRFGVIVPVLAMAGSLAAKKRIAGGAGTLPTHGPLFVTLLIGTVLLWAAELCSRAGPGAGGRAFHAVGRALKSRRNPCPIKPLTLFDPTLAKPAIVDAFKKLDPRIAMAQPGDVRGVRRQLS